MRTSNTNTVTMTKLLAEQKRQYRDDVDAARSRLKRLSNPSVKAAYKTMAAVVNLCDVVNEPRFEGAPVSHSEYLTYDAFMNATVYVRVSSLKSDKVLDLIEALEELIGECRSTADSVGDYSASRTFFFDSETMRLELTFDLPTDGDLCRRVKTGTRMVERATYAIECA